MQPVTDPYRALGVPRGATEADIKAAHRRLAKRYHPDASGGDSDRFLKVQEAYRVLSDPLLRREWDTAHAGPLRADPPATPRPKRARAARRETASQAETGTEPATGAAEGRGRGRSTASSGPGRPRSARAYTWSATEVPWWEEGAARQGRRRTKRAQETGPGARGDSQAGMGDTAATDDAQRADAAHDFDVYNRSSGAAWSMAARKYFRRDDQDLPRRGSFRHQGTQPITAARARAAAEAEARRPPAGPRAQPGRAGAGPNQRHSASDAPPPASREPASGPGAPAYAYASAGVARDPERVAHVRQAYQRRARALAWPSPRQRMLYALIAWLPLALLVGYGYSHYTGCGPLFMECSQSPEPALLVAVGILLLILVALPKVAYAGAMGTLAMLLVAAVATGLLAYMRAPLPPATAALIVLGVVMGIAYVTMMLIVALRGGPWRWVEPR